MTGVRKAHADKGLRPFARSTVRACLAGIGTDQRGVGSFGFPGAPGSFAARRMTQKKF